MLSFLKSVFGSDITETEYRYADDTPYYIRDGYTPQLLIWGQNQCIILTPDRKSHSFLFHVSAGISSVLGMFLP